MKRKRGTSPEADTYHLDDLIRLNAAILTALSLHYAHHGTSSPIDTRDLTPSITQIWGKRQVTLEDIRLWLSVLNQEQGRKRSKSSSTFSLATYANGKVCIELNEPRQKRGVLSQSFDEKALNTRFHNHINLAWSNWADKEDWETFLSSLPLADLPNSASYDKVAPLFAKGEQRLEQVLKPRANKRQSTKSGLKRRKVDSVEPLAQTEPSNTPQSVTTSISPDIEMAEAGIRGLGLIERIRQKEHYKSTLPTPPTKAEMARIAALQRAEELLGILDMLAVSKSAGLRVSFPLSSLYQSVQGSIRSPMSKEEIENCLGVLAEEIAIGYVSVSAFGSMKCVVINKAMKPEADEIREALVYHGVMI